MSAGRLTLGLHNIYIVFCIDIAMCLREIVTLQDVQSQVKQINSNTSRYNVFAVRYKRKTHKVLVFHD